MRLPHSLACTLAGLIAITTLLRAAETDADGFVPMFNGGDLTGWVNVNCAPETWTVRDGKIFCTGHPYGALRTPRQYENFIMELEWRHLTRSGNSGVFVWASPINQPGVWFLRAIEVQVLDIGYAEDYERKNGKKSTSFTVHGDVFPIQGDTMKPVGRTNGKRGFPSEDRSRPSPEWNHYRIVANNGTIRLSVNGKEVSGGDDCNYRKGYLGLESEGAPIEFRNIRIKELPPTNAAPELTAPLDPGWRSLFTSLDFRGWRANEATATRWKIVQEKLTLTSGAANEAATLWTEREFGNAEFVIDYEPAETDRPGATTPLTIFVRGAKGHGTPVTLAGAQPEKYSRFVVTVRNGAVQVRRDGQPAQQFPLAADAPARGALGFTATSAAGSFMNLHVRDL